MAVPVKVPLRGQIDLYGIMLFQIILSFNIVVLKEKEKKKKDITTKYEVLTSIKWF